MPKLAIVCDNCNKTFERYTWRVSANQKHFFCNRPCRNEYLRKTRKSEYDSFKDSSTHKMHEVVDSVKNVLPVMKSWSEYKEFCKKATSRIMSDEINPFK